MSVNDQRVANLDGQAGGGYPYPQCVGLDQLFQGLVTKNLKPENIRAKMVIMTS
jgi:hypothetical protein